MHLADQHPEADLAPPVGTPERAQFYKWMVHLSNTPQVEYRAWFYPWQHTADPGAVDAVKQASGERLGRMFDVIAGQLGDGPWLLGDRFSPRLTCSSSCWCGGAEACLGRRASCRGSTTMPDGYSHAPQPSRPLLRQKASRSRSSDPTSWPAGQWPMPSHHLVTRVNGAARARRPAAPFSGDIMSFIHNLTCRRCFGGSLMAAAVAAPLAALFGARTAPRAAEARAEAAWWPVVSQKPPARHRSRCAPEQAPCRCDERVPERFPFLCRRHGAASRGPTTTART